MTKIVGKVALLWRGDREARATATPANNRYHQIFQELTARGIHAEPAVYSEEAEDEVRAQLLGVDGALVWVNPQDGGRNRHRLDAMLRDVASQGVWVSAHPDVILKMGTKTVLFRTRELGWGCDTRLYGTFEAFREQFPSRLAEGVPRVLKPDRGNDGQGVWKVQLARGDLAGHSRGAAPSSDTAAVVLQAAADDHVEVVPLPEFLERCRAHFSGAGCLVDQAFQPRVGEGMIRCYLSQDRVVGFSEQWPRTKGTTTEAPALGMASAKTMHEPSAPRFRRLRREMEESWLPAMLGLLDLAPAALPAIWDADFLLGPPDASGEDSYVLCEINVSSVLPFPDTAAASVARTAIGCMETARQSRRAAVSGGG